MQQPLRRITQHFPLRLTQLIPEGNSRILLKDMFYKEDMSSSILVMLFLIHEGEIAPILTENNLLTFILTALVMTASIQRFLQVSLS